MQPPPAARRSLFGQSQVNSPQPSSQHASATISQFPDSAASTSRPATAVSSAGASVRNPPSPISFSPAARRPSFDLAAELLHSAADLREATDGDKQICVPAFPAFLVNALGGVLIQAKAFAVEAEARGETDGRSGQSSIPTLSRSMALLACLRHALPTLSAITAPYLLARESLTSLVADPLADTDLLEFVLDKSKSIPFTASSALCGPAHRLNLSLSADSKKHFAAAAHSLAVDLSQVVILVAAYTFATQHHLLAPRYRDLAADIVGQYEIRATYAAKIALSGLEMVQADMDIASRNRERTSG